MYTLISILITLVQFLFLATLSLHNRSVSTISYCDLHPTCESLVHDSNSGQDSSTTSWWLVAVVYAPLFKTLKKLEWRPRSETRWLGLNFGPFLIPPTRCWTHETATKLTSWTKVWFIFVGFSRIFILFQEHFLSTPILRVFDAQLNQLIKLETLNYFQVVPFNGLFVAFPLFPTSVILSNVIISCAVIVFIWPEKNVSWIAGHVTSQHPHSIVALGLQSHVRPSLSTNASGCASAQREKPGLAARES